MEGLVCGSLQEVWSIARDTAIDVCCILHYAVSDAHPTPMYWICRTKPYDMYQSTLQCCLAIHATACWSAIVPQHKT
jgi:hypothetical protein